MGYRFAGIFMTGPWEAAADLRRRLPWAQVRTVAEPFVGVAAAAPSMDDAVATEELAERMREEALRLSAKYPERGVLFLQADCFGGTCLYAGFTCRNGVSLRAEGWAPRGGGALRRLAAGLGAELDANEDFAPL